MGALPDGLNRCIIRVKRVDLISCGNSLHHIERGIEILNFYEELPRLIKKE